MNKQSMKWMAGLGLAVAMVCQVQAAGKTELVQRLVTAQRAQIQELSRSMVVGAVQGLMQELNAALGQVPEAKRDAVRAKLEAELRAKVRENPNVVLAIRSDTEAPVGQLVKVMDAAKAAHVKAVTAYTKQPGAP